MPLTLQLRGDFARPVKRRLQVQLADTYARVLDTGTSSVCAKMSNKSLLAHENAQFRCGICAYCSVGFLIWHSLSGELYARPKSEEFDGSVPMDRIVPRCLNNIRKGDN